MNASSSAWVGCSWVPSPALTTLERTQPECASRCGAPLAPWRTTTASAPIASSVSAVSLRLSPLDTLEPLAEKLMTSALSRLAAASKEIRVRVESSKKRLTTVRPRSAGSFLIGRSASERISSAVVEDQLGVVAAQVGRAQQVPLHWTPTTPWIVTASVSSTPARRDLDPLDQRGRQVLADEVGADRQLAVAAVDQDREPDRPRAADVVERVERGADGAAGEQHVVDEDDDLAVDAARRDLGRQRARGPASSAGRRGTSSRRASRRGRRTPRRRRSARRSAAASGTPRLGMPSRTRSSAPLLRSRISCEIRVRARVMSRASRTTRELVGRARRHQAVDSFARAAEGAQSTSASDLLLRLTGRLVKGCRSGRDHYYGRSPRSDGLIDPAPRTSARLSRPAPRPTRRARSRPARRPVRCASRGAPPGPDRVGDVADHEQPEAERGPVVHERRARAPGQPHQPGPVHDDAGAEQHAGRAGDQPGVDLLAGVELADPDRAVAAGPAAQPPPVGGGEPVEPAYVGAVRRRQRRRPASAPAARGRSRRGSSRPGGGGRPPS